jgi:hypothetical protein
VHASRADAGEFAPFNRHAATVFKPILLRLQLAGEEVDAVPSIGLTTTPNRSCVEGRGNRGEGFSDTRLVAEGGGESFTPGPGPFAAVPEPTTLAMTALGVACALLRTRRSRKVS